MFVLWFRVLTFLVLITRSFIKSKEKEWHQSIPGSMSSLRTFGISLAEEVAKLSVLDVVETLR